MLDQLGNGPSPSLNEAKAQIELELKSARVKKYNISDKSFNYIIDETLKQPEIKKMFEASLAVWYTFTREEIVKKCHKRLNRLNYNMKILKIQVRFIGKIQRLWNNTVEKLYCPDNIFVQECCQKYQNILKGTRKMPPKPPDFIDKDIKKPIP